MASLGELAESHSALSDAQIRHLQRLVGVWSLPCDLASSDLLLFAPLRDDHDRFVVLGHIRSSSGSTVYTTDPIGDVVDTEARPYIGQCFATGSRTSGSLDFGNTSVDCVPVRRDGEVIAVLTCEREVSAGRTRPVPEAEFQPIFERLAVMIEQGTFPAGRAEKSGEFREPRVGDGVLVFDRERRVEFTSPNAVSALHRLGVQEEVFGHRLDSVGIDDSVVRRALETRRSTVTEVHSGDDHSVVMRCHPLIDDARSTGVLMLTRDVSEIRSRDRLLVSKDATIREINHRVKNNLQTIQALLQLQARRLESREAKEAVEQSARRIGSIIIVHETLSTDATDEVDFDDVVGRVVRMVEKGFTAPERPVRITIDGGLGELAGETAMPLAVAVAELVQNALDHGLVDGAAQISIQMYRDRRHYVIRVGDNGPGLPDAFSLDRDAGLGLTIVRQFVVSDLGGTMTFGHASDTQASGMSVEMRVPRRRTNVGLG